MYRSDVWGSPMGVRSTQKIQVGSIVLVIFGHHNMRSGVTLLLWLLALMLAHYHPIHRLGQDFLSGLVLPKDACLGLSHLIRLSIHIVFFSFSWASALMTCAISLATDPFLTMLVWPAWKTRTSFSKLFWWVLTWVSRPSIDALTLLLKTSCCRTCCTISMVAASITMHRSTTSFIEFSWRAVLASLSWITRFNSPFSLSRVVIRSTNAIIYKVSLSSGVSCCMATASSGLDDRLPFPLGFLGPLVFVEKPEPLTPITDAFFDVNFLLVSPFSMKTFTAPFPSSQKRPAFQMAFRESGPHFLS